MERAYRVRTHDAWRSVAEGSDLNLEERAPSRQQTDLRLSGSFDVYEVDVQGRMWWGAEGDGQSETAYVVDLGGDPVWRSFSLCRGRLKGLRQMWPMRRSYVTFNDPEFDPWFTVKGSEVDEIRLRMDAWRRQWIETAMGPSQQAGHLSDRESSGRCPLPDFVRRS